MSLPKILFCCFLVAVLSCKKSSSGVSASLPVISVGDVTLTRDTINTTLKFELIVQPASDKVITVHYATEEGSAKENTDYTPVSGTLTISPNTTHMNVEIKVLGRKLLTSTQQFYLSLSNAVNAQLKAAKATATIKNPGFGYVLVYRDEFDSTALNTNDWNYETGGNGWGNNELEYYKAGTSNAYVQNGNLVIEAKKENTGSNSYTSARLTTKGKVTFTYGKIEIRAKLPQTKGIWPALWMLGENIDQVNWPNCGEIDIMELINSDPKVYGTAHWGSGGAHQSKGGDMALASGSFSDDFHVFTLEWDANQLKWSIDNNTFYQLDRASISSDTYPFDNDFFLILNVAVGGNWPGNPDFTSVFPQQMLVDYVRVYQK